MSSRRSGSRFLATLVAVGVLLVAVRVEAWNVRCFHEPDDADCTDPYDDVQTPWRADPQAEHRAILTRTLEIAGLPAAFREPFELTLFANGQALSATVTAGDGTQTFTHQSIRPVRLGARERRTREVSIPAMASLPDFSYTLWDWASGNELCPPAPGGEPVDCHNYETHIGWLNSNHMLPQARRFYDYLHELALEKADACKTLHDALSATDRERFSGFLLACEQMALVIEGVAHHYLQDAWALGHMWERWGGAEPADFGGNRTLGFAVAGFVGSIHGSKAVLDADPVTAFAAPWDDPMNAPHFDAQYVDAANGALRLGVGDVFLADWIFSPPPFLFLPPSLDPQRHAMLGCAVDGIRAVYERTAQFHGALGAAATAEFDGGRDVDDESCWGQRATNRAVGLGCGIHNGTAPGQSRLLGGGLTSIIFWALADAEARGLPPLGPALTLAFQRDAAYACTLAMAAGAVPILAEQTNLAAGGLPSIAGVLPNSAYARGGVGTPPTSYADPALPWNVDASDPALREREEALNLTFADAHAAERCHDYSEADLLEFRAQVVQAQEQANPVVVDARCGQCIQQVAPHLRRGRPGEHDARREAFCGLVGPPDAAFVHTGEDPETFTGDEPTDLASLLAATEEWCCSPGLFFDFSEDRQGWEDGTAGGNLDTVRRLTRNDGVMKLDGVDNPDNTEPNAWIFRTVELPDDATTLAFDVSAHDRDGANALYRVRLQDENGTFHTLIDWTPKSGVEGSLTFSRITTGIAAFADQTVVLFLEQDGDAPGAHEQIYYDNVSIE